MTYRELFFNLKAEARLKGREESAAKTLFLDICKFNLHELIMRYDDNVPPALLSELKEKFYLLIEKNIPVQYILGYVYFYGLRLAVDSKVLIPRPETEELVQSVLSHINRPDISLIDIGCGSGAIALALKKNLPDAHVTATDISEDAIIIAKKNAVTNNVSLEFIISDLFENVTGKYDIIVSNPPYLKTGKEAWAIVRDNEPALALYAAEDGLYYYRKILSRAPLFLKRPGMIFLEIPANRQDGINALLREFASAHKCSIEKDLSGRNRILIIEYD